MANLGLDQPGICADTYRPARAWDAAHPESRGLVLLIRSRIQRSEAGLDLAPLRT